MTASLCSATDRVRFVDRLLVVTLLDGRTHTIKGVLNDQCSLVRNSLSVLHRRPRFARPPIGVRRDRLLIRKGRDRRHIILFLNLTPFLRILRILQNWSFRIKTVLNDQCGSVRNGLLVRRRRPRFARPPIGFGSSLGFRMDGTYGLTHAHNQI